MRIAIVSDIHGNRTAFEAVLADLRQTAPDLFLRDGDARQGLLRDAVGTPLSACSRLRLQGQYPALRSGG